MVLWVVDWYEHVVSLLYIGIASELSLVLYYTSYKLFISRQYRGMEMWWRKFEDINVVWLHMTRPIFL